MNLEIGAPNRSFNIQFQMIIILFKTLKIHTNERKKTYFIRWKLMDEKSLRRERKK